MKPTSGLSFVEILLSILVLSLIVVSIQQFLAVSIIVTGRTGSDFLCMVAANNVMEMGMASSTVLLKGLISFIGATAVDQWQPLPPDFVPGGPGSFRAQVSLYQSALFEGVATKTAVINIVDDQFNGIARVQGFRDTIE